MNHRPWLFLPAALICVTIGLIPAPAGLEQGAMWALGLLVGAVVAWVGDAAPDYGIALLMATLWAALGLVPFPVAFSTFAQPTFWLVFAALGLGATVASSGLLKRVALLALLRLPPTFPGQVLGLALSGLAFGPTLPSVMGKISISSRLVRGMADAQDLRDGSNHAAGLFFGVYLGYALMSPMFMTGSLANFLILGLLPAAVRGGVHWFFWFGAMAPAVLVMGGLSYLAILKLFKPEGRDVLPKEYLLSELRQLGTLTRAEQACAAVLGVTLLLWVSEPWHGVSATVVALLGLGLLICLGVLDRKAFQAGISWGSLVFVGVVINLSVVFSHLGLDAWLSQLILPVVSPMAANGVVLIVVLTVCVYALRLVIVSYNALIAILFIALVPALATYGYHPWLIGMLIHLGGQAVILHPYLSPMLALAEHSCGTPLATHRQLRSFGLAVLAANLAGVFCAIPLWRALGLM